jgi:hypothetical protein
LGFSSSLLTLFSSSVSSSRTVQTKWNTLVLAPVLRNLAVINLRLRFVKTNVYQADASTNMQPVGRVKCQSESSYTAASG